MRNLVARAVMVRAHGRNGGAADVGCVAAHLGRAGPERMRVMGLNVGLHRRNELQIGRCLDGVVRVGAIHQVLVRVVGRDHLVEGHHAAARRDVCMVVVVGAEAHERVEYEGSQGHCPLTQRHSRKVLVAENVAVEHVQPQAIVRADDAGDVPSGDLDDVL